MADPDSSIKSIFSGKISINDTDDEFDSQIMRSHKNIIAGSSHDASLLPMSDNNSVTSQNLRYLNQSEAYTGRNELFPTSTNVSVVSSCSDYQHPFSADTDSFSLATNQGQGLDNISRPVSRNSMTSCLSTTATKDGIEGKKIHRHGPSPYFANVINNTVHHQQQPSAQPVPLRNQSYHSTQEPSMPRIADIGSIPEPPVTVQEKISLMNKGTSKRL